MKKILLTLITPILLAGCSGLPRDTEVFINCTPECHDGQIEIHQGDTVTLTATITGNTNRAVMWSKIGAGLLTVHGSSADFSSDGAGTARVTAKPAADQSKSASIGITIARF